jgi:hypothetical protein
MNARALLEDLTSQGVRLEADGERLIVDVPTGTMTDELRETLTDLKPEILEHIRFVRREVEAAELEAQVRCWREEEHVSQTATSVECIRRLHPDECCV